MRRFARAIASAALVACGPKPAPAVAIQADRSAVTTALAAGAVDAQHFARRTLYSWTTHDQIVELAKTKRLLVREESPTHGASYVDQVVHALVVGGDPIAKLLYTTTFAKARFAWPNAWATRRGWPGETYGDELLRITLKPDAIVLALSSATHGFTAHDLADHPVPVATVLAHPERIAALYFVSDVAAALPGLPPMPALYREYVVCNEAAIESWAVGTDDVAREATAEAELIERLATTLEDPAALPDARASWERPGPPSLEGAYVAALAFVNGWYALDRDAMITLAKALRDTPRTLAFTGAPTQPFPGIGALRPPPRVIAKPAPTSATQVGTYVAPPKKPVP